MSTQSIVKPNGSNTTILHKQFKEYLVRTFKLDEQSIEIIDQIIVRFLTLAHRINWLEKKQTEYESKPLCSGVPYWPKDNEGYLKCNHGVGQECPMHGSPKNERSRLRIGVGRDQHEIKRVLTAIDDYSTYQKILRELAEKKNALQSMQYKVMNSIGIYHW